LSRPSTSFEEQNPGCCWGFVYSIMSRMRTGQRSVVRMTVSFPSPMALQYLRRCRSRRVFDLPESQHEPPHQVRR
jgi:hypothetical protein